MCVVRRSSNRNTYIAANLSTESRMSAIRVSLICRPFLVVLVSDTEQWRQRHHQHRNS
eukprot:COSAG05_NODE_6803_length_900_cov_1.647940_1_plen_57_part_10